MRPFIGLDMLHYAILDSDTASGTIYDSVTRVYNVVSASINPNSVIETFFADDGPREVFSQIGEVDVALQVSDLPAEHYAALTGATFDPLTGEVSYTVDAVAPDVAIGFRAQKSDGNYRYFWLVKGRFGLPNMEHQTKESGVSFQSQTINGKFAAREYDSMVFRRVDSEDALTNIDDTWFDSPNAVAPDPMTVNSVTFAANSVTWNFDDIDVFPPDANNVKFLVYEIVAANDYDPVSGEVAIHDDNDDEVVFTPDSSLDGNYLAIAEAGVRGTDGSDSFVLLERHIEDGTV